LQNIALLKQKESIDGDESTLAENEDNPLNHFKRKTILDEIYDIIEQDRGI